jgi:ABC-type transport system substrate-binding protein
MGSVPNAKTNDAAATYGDRYYERPNNFHHILGFPMYDDAFKDKRIRQALSLAIDRQAINRALYNGTYTPATSLISPNFPGARSSACTYCAYDVQRAKNLLTAAGGWSGGLLQLWTIAGADQQVCCNRSATQIKAGLGIDYELQVSCGRPSTTKRPAIRGFTGPFQLGWAPDYPYVETYLAPLYATGGSANSSGYSSHTFDQYLAQANAAKTADDALELYRKAEDVVLADIANRAAVVRSSRSGVLRQRPNLRTTTSSRVCPMETSRSSSRHKTAIDTRSPRAYASCGPKTPGVSGSLHRLQPRPQSGEIPWAQLFNYNPNQPVGYTNHVDDTEAGPGRTATT